MGGWVLSHGLSWVVTVSTFWKAKQSGGTDRDTLIRKNG